MKKLLSSRKGNIALTYLGFAFFLLMLAILIMEMGSVMENYACAEDVLQRACNSAVEANINDAYRADRILIMDPDGAKNSFRNFVSNDLPAKYQFSVTNISCTASPPSMTVTGTLTFPTVFSEYGFSSVTHTVKVISTNYDLD